MNLIQRREFLALGSSLLLAQASAEEAKSPAKTSSPPNVLPDAWIQAPSIPIWPSGPPGADHFAAQSRQAEWPATFLSNVAKPDLHVFRPEKSNGYALLVIPGGAYWFVSIGNEGVEVADRMTALGFTVFVLTYRLPGEGWQNRSNVPLQDAQRAIRLIRSSASQFGFDANKVGVLGFSAGGHLAATLSTQHMEHTYDAIDAIDQLSPRPFATGLIYPVVTMEKPWTHEKSRNLLLGDTPGEVEIFRRCPERHVDANTPPIFIVHAVDDAAVPVENSLRLLNAMREAKRPVEAHLLQEGGHAFGVGRPNTPSAQWINLFVSWLQRI